MTLQELVVELRSRNVRLRRVGDEIEHVGPAGALAGPVRKSLINHRQAILILLGVPSAWPEDRIDQWKERTSIMVWDGGMGVEDAQRESTLSLRRRWLP